MSLFVGTLAMTTMVYMLSAKESEDPPSPDVVGLTIASSCLGSLLSMTGPPTKKALRVVLYSAYFVTSWPLCFFILESPPQSFFGLVRIEALAMGLAIAFSGLLASLRAQHQTMKSLTELEHQQPQGPLVWPTFRPHNAHTMSSSPSRRPGNIDVSQGTMAPGVAPQEGQGEQYRDHHPQSQTVISIASGSLQISPCSFPSPGSPSSSTATLPRLHGMGAISVTQSLPRSTGSPSSNSLTPATVMEVPTVFESAVTGGYPPTLPTATIQVDDTSANLPHIRIHPEEYKLVGVGWWQELDMWKQEFLLITAVGRDGSTDMETETVFIRVERYQTSWTNALGGNATWDSMTIGTSEDALTINSTLIAALDIEADTTLEPTPHLRLLDQVLAAARGTMSEEYGSCYRTYPKRLRLPQQKDLAAHKYDIPPTTFTLERGIVRRVGFNELVVFCRDRTLRTAWTLGLSWVWPRLVIFGVVVGSTLLICGYGKVLILMALIGSVLWILNGWYNTLRIIMAWKRVNPALEEGRAITASHLKDYKWPLTFAGGVTCALLGVLALAITGMVKEQVERLFFATAVMMVVVPHLLIQIGHVVYWILRSGWILMNQPTSDIFCGTEHPYHYLRHGGDDIPGSPRDFTLVEVSWWQQSDMWKHQFLVIHSRSTTSSETASAFVRLEREKNAWFHWRRGNTNSTVRLAATLEGLTQDAVRIASFSITEPQWDYHLPMLGELVRIVNERSPIYFLPTLNCYWFAFTCFERLGSRIGWENAVCRADMTLLGEQDVRPMSEDQMLKFCFQRMVAHAMLLSHSAVAGVLLMALPAVSGFVCGVKIARTDEAYVCLHPLSWMPLLVNVWLLVFWAVILSAYWRVSKSFGSPLNIRSFLKFLRRYALTLLVPQLLFMIGAVDGAILVSVTEDVLN
ncbi:hypothetical protein FRB96_007213 [Tulasnella sp. 330]|nr:hypothetical protein FRB96_007213 [Tulasnella sp. 330]